MSTKSTSDKVRWLKDAIWAISIFAVGASIICPIFFLLFSNFVLLQMSVGIYGFAAALCEFLGARARATFVAGVILPLTLPPIYLMTLGPLGEGGYLFLILIFGTMRFAALGWIVGFTAVRSAYASVRIFKRCRQA